MGAQLVETFGAEKLTAWQMGFAAYAKAGLRLSDNPFPAVERAPFTGGHAHHSWACGWMAAQDEHHDSPDYPRKDFL